ncbi:MAG: hypothetical protein V2I54_02905 [Bacteroidales bacterium]|jgi:hypothetical protein|nr:hypothetical protein [Bacteroidales bacterium]
MKKLLLGLFIFIPFSFVFSQKIATTECGEKVVLYKNGTWNYVDSSIVSSVENIINNNRPNIKELNANKVEFYDKKIEVCGYANIKNWYFDGYRNKESLYYCLEIRDNNGSIYAYLPKNKTVNKELFEVLVGRNDVPICITGIIIKDKQTPIFVYLEGESFNILTK